MIVDVQVVPRASALRRGRRWAIACARRHRAARRRRRQRRRDRRAGPRVRRTARRGTHRSGRDRTPQDRGDRRRGTPPPCRRCCAASSCAASRCFAHTGGRTRLGHAAIVRSGVPEATAVVARSSPGAPGGSHRDGRWACSLLGRPVERTAQRAGSVGRLGAAAGRSAGRAGAQAWGAVLAVAPDRAGRRDCARAWTPTRTPPPASGTTCAQQIWRWRVRARAASTPPSTVRTHVPATRSGAPRAASNGVGWAQTICSRCCATSCSPPSAGRRPTRRASPRTRGQGFLQNWVRVTATRAFIDRSSRPQRTCPELPIARRAGRRVARAGSRSGAGAAQAATRRALQGRVRRGCWPAGRAPSGSCCEQHLVERLTIDQIGALYHLHRATAARRVVKARESLLAGDAHRAGSAAGSDAGPAGERAGADR